MGFESIGRNIRKYRIEKSLRQEDLAEMTGLSTNYIGALDRCDKIPSLETFIEIVNALGVTSDMVLYDVLDRGYTIRNSLLSDKIEKLSADDQKRIYDVVDVLIRHSSHTKQ